MSFDPEPFAAGSSLLQWLKAFGGFMGIVFMVACLLSMVAHGLKGPKSVLHWIGRFAVDLLTLSPKRVGALTRLTFKEAVRRKALWVFGIFAMLFMFGSWFMDQPNPRFDLQVKLYVSFVLTAITWLILPVMLLLSCWALPEDIKNRSLHTVVTKPVRKTEIVTGRVLGFVLLMTLLLAVMGTIGYVWIDREAAYNLKIVDELLLPDDKDEAAPKEETLVKASLLEDVRVELIVGVNATQVYQADSVADLARKHPDVANLVERARLQSLRNRLVARVPKYGYLGFKGHDGRPTEKGVNTGDIWEFRTYIEGRSNWRGLWDFEGIQEDPDGLDLESNFEAFRTHKGTLGQSLMCQYVLVNIDRYGYQQDNGSWVSAERVSSDNQHATLDDGTTVTVTRVPVPARDVRVSENRIVLKRDPLIEIRVDELLRVPQTAFQITEFRENIIHIDPEITYNDPENKTQITKNLYRDLVNKQGELRIEVVCLDHGQYLGMARPDLFIKQADNSFLFGYTKAVIGVWLMLSLVIILGVTASCFLKGPIAMLLTFVMLIVGQGFREFLDKIVAGQVLGGGTLESIVRMVQHINLTDTLPDRPFYNVIKGIDRFFTEYVLYALRDMVPDFRHFQMAPYVANGYDVPWSQSLLPSIAMVAAYLLPCLVIGYYSLSLRELEHK